MSRHLSKWTNLNINLWLALFRPGCVSKILNTRWGKSGFRALPDAKNSLGQKSYLNMSTYLSKWTNLNINLWLALFRPGCVSKILNTRWGKSGFRALPDAKNSLGQKSYLNMSTYLFLGIKINYNLYLLLIPSLLYF